MKMPTPLLSKISEVDEQPVSIAMCPDFESGQWRHKALVEHLFDWLPEVALKPEEHEALLYEPNKLLARAAQRVFKDVDPEKRGEVGEILLHAVCRQEFGTLPVIARLFYKFRSNDQVTSVDVVHITFDEKTQKVDLWLGEAKLYKNLRQARSKAIKSVSALWNAEFLSEMKALVGPKIDSKSPHAEALRWLFSEEVSLDQIVDSIVIPICLAVDFDPTKSSSFRTPNYIEKVSKQLAEMRAYFIKRIPANVRFVCIFVPLDCKDKLEKRMLAKLGSFQ